MEKMEALQHDTERQIMQILWHFRMTEPNMAVRIREKDIEALNQCLEFNKQEATIKVIASPNGDMTVVMVDKQGNAITPIENNQEDFDKAQYEKTKARAKETIRAMANRVKNAALSGEFSASDVGDLADAAELLAR